MIMVGGRVLGNEFAGHLFALTDAVYLAALGVVRREVGGRMNREMRGQLASQGKTFTPFPLGQGQNSFLGQRTGQGAATEEGHEQRQDQQFSYHDVCRSRRRQPTRPEREPKLRRNPSRDGQPAEPTTALV